jgi:type IV pilus assembly protein PilQ
MITRAKKIIFDSAVALFVMVVFAGCAQTGANIRGGDAVEINGAAAIQEIKLASDASQVEVLTDKALSYTYYKTSDPPRVVIDLAQTEPGKVSRALEVNSGNIKRIDVTKHEFTGGFLSRIEIILTNEECDFSVTTDSADKGKLLVNFTAPSAEVKQVAEVKGESKPTTAAETDKTVASQQQEQPVKEPASITAATKTQDVNKDAQPAPVVAPETVMEEKQPSIAASKAVEPAVEPKPATAEQQQKILRSVAAGDDGIEIGVSGGVDNFNAFKLTKPDRLVLDLPGVKSGIAAKTIAIDRFSVGQVRQGIYPDKIRIVMDAAKAPMPTYKVIKGTEGLKVVFAEVPAPAVATVSNKSAGEQEKNAIVGNKADTPLISAIEAIDFKVVDDSSRIAIKVTGKCNAGKPVKVTGGLSLTIKNCQVPRQFQRMIDTGAFPSVVKMITPYQVKMKKGNDARILVKLKQATTYTVKQDGDTLIWDIKNPEDLKSDSATTRPAESAPAAKIAAVDSPSAPAEKAALHSEKAVQEKQVLSEPKYAEKKIYTGRRVSLEFSDADIRKILQLIAEVSNLNFLIGDDVSGTISIKLVNVPWDQALDVILETKGLEKKQDGNIMYIKPKGKFKTEDEEEAEAKKVHERRLELKTRVFDVNFADINEITTKLFDKLKSDRGTIASDERTNRIIVTDNEERLDKMQLLLKELDLPEKQVMIEARIVEASSSFTRELGVNWGLHFQDDTASVLGIRRADVGMGGITTPPPVAGVGASAGGAAGISFGTLGSDIRVDLRLSAAATIGQIKIISTPKIITLNNKSAKISQGQNIPYSTVSAEGTKTEWVEAALTLEVTPHVASDGTISMKIKATNNSAGTGSPPPINKKEATTEVQVMSGETTVIGGIYQDHETDSDSGMPWMQDIPLFGWLFKSNFKEKTRTELLIFITPKIVS